MTAPAVDNERTFGVLEEILGERTRQQRAEGFTLAHDDARDPGALAGAAGAYALNAGCILHPFNGTEIEDPTLFGWTFEPEFWKPTTPRRDLVKAAALIVAEIERIDRGAAAERRRGDG